jgi:general secretion pathway protein F
VDEALAALSDQSQKARVQSVVLALRARVREGATLADAMGGFGESFPELTRAAVAAGEQSGQLGPALLRLADYSERRAEFRQGLISALAYPVLLTSVALLIVTGCWSTSCPRWCTCSSTSATSCRSSRAR